MQTLIRVKQRLDSWCGIEKEEPSDEPIWKRSVFALGLLWAILLLVILTFSGQSSKFIYIDF